jgi:uncharacterized iron-regulated protein
VDASGNGTADAGAPHEEGFRTLDGKTGQPVANAALFAALSSAKVVCLGEQHDDPDHHAFQAEAVRRLIAAGAAAKQAQATGFEMFQVPFQPVLDRYAASQIDEATLLANTEWQTRWGFDYGYYRPIVQGSVSGGARLLAWNAAAELTQKIGKTGLASLTQEERAHLPAALDTTTAAHRAWFTAAIQEGHGTPTGDLFERMYAVQVVWDTTMADVSARWLAGQARAQVAVIAGNGHCHTLGIPLRLQQRGVASVSVHLVAEDAVEIDAAVREGLSTYVVAIQRGWYASHP